MPPLSQHPCCFFLASLAQPRHLEAEGIVCSCCRGWVWEAPGKRNDAAAVVRRLVTSNPRARNSKRRAERRGRKPQIPGWRLNKEPEPQLLSTARPQPARMVGAWWSSQEGLQASSPCVWSWVLFGPSVPTPGNLFLLPAAGVLAELVDQPPAIHSLQDLPFVVVPGCGQGWSDGPG